MLRIFYNMAHVDFKIRQNVMNHIFDAVSKNDFISTIHLHVASDSHSFQSGNYIITYHFLMLVSDFHFILNMPFLHLFWDKTSIK
jgi:hypothetical protein